jgi:hypothetical protein
MFCTVDQQSICLFLDKQELSVLDIHRQLFDVAGQSQTVGQNYRQSKDWADSGARSRIFALKKSNSIRGGTLWRSK